jgi:hypothetical protein
MFDALVICGNQRISMCADISGVPREDVPRWLCRFRGNRVNLLDESHERRDLQARYVGLGYS